MTDRDQNRFVEIVLTLTLLLLAISLFKDAPLGDVALGIDSMATNVGRQVLPTNLQVRGRGFDRIGQIQFRNGLVIVRVIDLCGANRNGPT